MSNKLFITNKFSGNIFAQQATLKYSVDYFQENGWVTKYFNDDWDNSLDNSLDKFDIIVIWSIQQVDGQRKYKKIVLDKLLKMQSRYKYIIFDYVEDVHRMRLFYKLDSNYYRKNFNKKTKNYILLRNERSINKYFPSCNCYVIPFSIEPSIVPEFNPSPKNIILLTGNLKQKAYPKRAMVYNLKNKHKIDVLSHPSYHKLEHGCIGKKYLQKINEYVSSVSSCGLPCYNYVVAKYFEIPGSGSLLLAYTEPITKELLKYGFKDMENMISFNDSNIDERIQFILNPKNKKEINRIRLNGYNLIKDKHTHKTRFYLEFDQFISKLLNK